MISRRKSDIREGFLEPKLVLHLKKMREINPLCLLHIENQETSLYVVSHYPLATYYYVGSKVLTAGKDQIIVPHLHAYSEAEKRSLEYLSPE